MTKRKPRKPKPNTLRITKRLSHEIVDVDEKAGIVTVRETFEAVNLNPQPRYFARISMQEPKDSPGAT